LNQEGRKNIRAIIASLVQFTYNDSYFNGRRLEQEPTCTPQLHATYNFGRGVWLPVSGTYDYGGRPTVNGVEREDLQSNTRMGATLALPVNTNNSIKLYANRGLPTRISNNYDLIGAAWQYR